MSDAHNAAFKIPGGPERGTPVEQASAKTLDYWIRTIATALEAGTSRNPSRDKQLLAAMKAALATGNRPRTTQRARPNNRERDTDLQHHAGHAIARVTDAQLAQVTGTFDTRASIAAMLQEAAKIGTLVAPQTVVGELPIGTGLATSVVPIDVDKETYAVRGGLTLSKPALMRIAAAGDISWDPVHSRRTDDRSDPHYCAWQAYGWVRNFDGSPRGIMGSAAVDVRDGSQRARATERRAQENGKPNEELAMLRQFIERHAEARAMNAAIRGYMGRSMQWSREDLAKPLIVVKLIFTGRSDNPEIQRLFAERMFDAFHNAGRTLYGGGSTPQLPAGHTPPPLAAGDYHDDDEDEDQDQGDEYEDETDDDSNDEWGISGEYGQDEQR